MKIKKYVMAMVMIVACTLLGCQEKHEERTEEKSGKYEDWNSDYSTSCFYQFVTEAEKGYYLALSNFLYYLEKEETEPIILCSKPNCQHEDQECNAYFPQRFPQIMYADGKIYGFREDQMTFAEELVAVSADGETKEVLINVDNRDVNYFRIHRGYAYYVRSGSVNPSLMAYDLEDKKEKEILCEKDVKEIKHLFCWQNYLYIPITEYDEEENVYFRMKRYDIETENLSDFFIEDEQTGEKIEDLLIIGAEGERLTLVGYTENAEKNPVYVCGLDGGKAVKGMSLPLGMIVTDGEYIFGQDVEAGCCVIYDSAGAPQNQFDGWEGADTGYIASGSHDQAFMLKVVEENGIYGDAIYILDKSLIGTDTCQFEEIIRKPWILGQSFQ